VLLSAMRPLWLTSVPLTLGLTAHFYGLRCMGTLYVTCS
jgi:hypothetical protein